MILTDGPILTDGLDFPEKLKCCFNNHICKYLKYADNQYPYCTAQPDTMPILRDGWGTFLYSAEPNDGCPYPLKKEI